VAVIESQILKSDGIIGLQPSMKDPVEPFRVTDAVITNRFR